MNALLSERQRTIVGSFLDDRGLERAHLVIALSGAHAYGFPSPDSDVDLKCVHIAPLRQVLALEPPPAVADRLEVVDGVELDYGSNEIGPVLTGFLRGNGNFAERLLGPNALRAAPALVGLRPLAAANVSRRFHRHYHGFATSQRKLAEAGRSAKRVLYVLRTALTGAYLLETGAFVTDLPTLAPRYAIDVSDLIAAKQHGERAALDDRTFAGCIDRMNLAFSALDAAHAGSPLGESPPSPSDLDDWLYQLRRDALA